MFKIALIVLMQQLVLKTARYEIFKISGVLPIEVHHWQTLGTTITPCNSPRFNRTKVVRLGVQHNVDAYQYSYRLKPPLQAHLQPNRGISRLLRIFWDASIVFKINMLVLRTRFSAFGFRTNMTSVQNPYDKPSSVKIVKLTTKLDATFVSTSTKEILIPTRFLKFTLSSPLCSFGHNSTACYVFHVSLSSGVLEGVVQASEVELRVCLVRVSVRVPQAELEWQEVRNLPISRLPCFRNVHCAGDRLED